MTPQMRGLRALMAAQFLSALADNALLIVAIALLDSRAAAAWMTPFLKFFFIASFVAFASVVGVIADSFAKPRVMMTANTIKGLGCVLMIVGFQPLLAYALVGFGAAAYSPAKYGLLTELVPAQRLVRANAWLEGLTIASVILGALVGGALVSPEFAMASVQQPARTPGALQAALAAVLATYLVAATLNLLIPDSGIRHFTAHHNARALFRGFRNSLRTMLDDPSGRAPLLVTTLLWGVGATLQFVVIDWSRERLMLSLDRAAMLPGIVAVGVAIGAVCAARWVVIDRALSILPFGLLFGPLVIAVLPFHSLPVVVLLLFLNGIAAGLFIVPMNALFQHRGAELVNAGQAIAVQNFCENLSVMMMLCAYALLRATEVPLVLIVIALGVFTSAAIAAIRSHSAARDPGGVATTAAGPR